MQSIPDSFANIAIVLFDLGDCLDHKSIQNFLFLFFCGLLAFFDAIAVGNCIAVIGRIAVFFVLNAVFG